MWTMERAHPPTCGGVRVLRSRTWRRARSASFAISVILAVVVFLSMVFSTSHAYGRGSPSRHVASSSSSTRVPTTAPDVRHVPSFTTTRRQACLAFWGFCGAAVVVPPGNAAYVLNDDSGEYEQVEDQDWQTTWKERLDKASTMSPDQVFLAAKGAGNVDLKQGPETDVSKKRRAMAGCRDKTLRQKAGLSEEKACNARVLQGDIDFMIQAMDGN
jgi:hypothetical protein